MLGISVDSEWCHAAFAKELGLAYPLLADFHPKGEVAKKYGLYLEEWGIRPRHRRGRPRRRRADAQGPADPRAP